MAQLDWSSFEEPEMSGKVRIQPGRYFAKVESASERKSKKGDSYINMRLVAVDHDDAHICFDVLMLEGKARNIGYAKLKQLGVDSSEEWLDAKSLVNRKCYVEVEEETYKDETRLSVNIGAKDGACCGYWSIDSPPPMDDPEMGYEKPDQPDPGSDDDEDLPEEPLDVGDTPF